MIIIHSSFIPTHSFACLCPRPPLAFLLSQHWYVNKPEPPAFYCPRNRLIHNLNNQAPPEALPLATLLSTLPPTRPSCLAEIQRRLAQQGKDKHKKLVIVDGEITGAKESLVDVPFIPLITPFLPPSFPPHLDDPTGTQSVRGFPVLAEWTPEALAREISDESTPGFFLLSNIRCEILAWDGGRQGGREAG